MQKIKLYSILILTLVKCNLISQNLVPNPSFEIFLSCDSFGSGISRGNFPPWDSPTYGSPDGFNSCDNLWLYNSPINVNGYQFPHSGNGYIGEAFWIGGGAREYSQVELNSPFVAQEHYCVSFYVSYSNRSTTASNNFGIYISDNHIYVPNLQYLNFVPQINDTNIVTDTLNWTLVYGQYTAHGGERYIIIGNFYSDAQTNTINASIGGPAYYYIDDVNVHCCTCDSMGSGISELSTETRWGIAPNPNNGEFKIDLNKEYKDVKLEIFDVLGKLVYSTKEKETKQLKLNLNVSPGVYFVSVTADDRKQVLKLVKE